jgi:RNA recognition motif-containing protein
MAENKCSPPTQSQIDDIKHHVLKLLEFYFGDSNLQKDRFLKQLMDADPEGYIDLHTVASFNKMRSLTTDFNVIVEAARASSILQLDHTNTKVKRIAPVPKAVNTDARTVYAELFPADSTHASLERIFSTCGNVTYISMPRHKETRETKGFAFIEYEKEDDAACAVKTLNTVNNPSHNPIAPNGMRVISKDEWQRLKDEYREMKMRQQLSSSSSSQPSKCKKAPSPGLIVHFKNVGPGVSGKDIKEYFKRFARVAYIEFEQGGTEGYARFFTTEGANAAVDKMLSQNAQLGGQQIALRILEGEEDQQYWAKIHQNAAQKYQSLNETAGNFLKAPKSKLNIKNKSKKFGQKEEQTEHFQDAPPTKKQKKESKALKFQGKKEPKVATAKPKVHIFFGNEENEAITNTSTEVTNTHIVEGSDA